MHRNTILIPDRRMLYGLPEHAVQVVPVSERVKAFCLNIMNISIYRKIDQFKEKFRAFLLPFRISGAKMVASLCVETTK